MDTNTHQESGTTIMDTNTHQESETTIMDTNVNQESESCNLCKRNFHNKALLKSHHVKHHYIRKCPNCYKTFQQTKKYLMHLRTHINDCPYECKICLKSFNSKAYLREHMLDHKNLGKKICTVCSTVCYTHFGLMRHMLTHGKQPYECSMCDSIFSSVADRSRHIKNHIIRCGVCKIPLKDNNALIQHIIEFHRPKNKNASGLKKQPLKVPDIVVKAECDSSDSMAESSSDDDDSDSSLNDDENNADIESVYYIKHKDNFICFICLQLCPSSEWLKYHMDFHTWFPCPHCSKYFHCNRELDKHKMKNHSRHCTKCDTIFECEKDLNFHEQKCSMSSNLTSKVTEEVSPFASQSISKDSDFEKELNEKLKEIEKTALGNIKISYTIESRYVERKIEDLCFLDAYLESEKELFKKFGGDQVLDWNYKVSIVFPQMSNFIRGLKSLKFPLERNILKQCIHLERIVEDALFDDTAGPKSEEEIKYLQDAHLYLSTISNRHLNISYD